MGKLSKREKYLIIGALVFSSIALFVYFYYFPLKNEITELERESTEISLQLDEKKSLAVKIENVKKETDELSKRVEEDTAILIDTIDEPELLNYVYGKTVYREDGANISNVQAITYEPIAVQENELYYSKDIELKFQTEYADLKDILKSFETGENYAYLSDITINKAGESGSSTPGQEVTPPDGNEIPEGPPVTTTMGNQVLDINCRLRFYGEDPTWDGSGEYKFMEEGQFKKDNLFE